MGGSELCRNRDERTEGNSKAVGVIGLGHVGLVSACCFAALGHHVIGVDADREKLRRLERGFCPFYEPGLEDLLREGIASGALELTEDAGDAARACEVLFICVGTPLGSDGRADLLQIERLAAQIAPHLESYKVVVEKSTVPVHTGKRLVETLARYGAHDFDVVSNPEFLREGRAVEDTLRPDRVVVGSDSERATRSVLEVLHPVISATGCPVVVTDLTTAELLKHASNAFLAMKISFINAVAEVCEAAGADVDTVADGMGLDPRIGREFLGAGIGYGGACFPKDIAAFEAMASEIGVSLPILEQVREINERAARRLVDRLRDELWHLQGKRLAALGLSFKAGTDDIRESPAIKVIRMLLMEGAEVVAYDPEAMPAAKESLPRVHLAPSALDAAKDADALLLLTDWDEFRRLDPRDLRAALRFAIVADGRNLFDPAAMAAAGLTYISVGRPVVRPQKEPPGEGRRRARGRG
ncbi:MAG TPA: UDP-glucose/GDP-mannose dehydrogenase family protein [Actinomycetota bacterium]|jgi:UDPglucose 6-dehydrogenase|nr:UDP-glucose/GDP-mannose dehydrogenase family protein [Actinomycetota bacterium]